MLFITNTVLLFIALLVTADWVLADPPPTCCVPNAPTNPCVPGGVLPICPLPTANTDEFSRKHITEFQAAVEGILPHQYMKEDFYLSRYLASRNFSVPAATAYLKENLEWRAIENVDTILEEDWSDFARRFPYNINSITKAGRPLLYYNINKWNLQEEVNEKNFQKLLRYTSAKAMEHAEQTLRSLRRAGNEVGQFDIITNMEGFGAKTLKCTLCIKGLKDSAQISHYRFPLAVANVFLVNVPKGYENSILQVFEQKEDAPGFVRHVLGGRESYMPALLKHMDKDQIPSDLQ